MSISDIQRLEKIRQINTANPKWVNRDLYRLLYKEDLYVLAYETLKSKSGNMTKDADGNTIDGFSARTISRLINAMKDESYQFTAARKVEIPKANGKKRALGIAPPNDKIVQQIIKLILEAIYEPNFSDNSHGFRENMGCHTALKSFRTNWSGVNWIVEGDIEGFFDNISHDILISLLRERIADERFINLIRKALNAGYLEFGMFHNTVVGTPQGSVVSPTLANIYLDGFDKFVEAKIKEYERGETKITHPKHRSLSSKINYRLKKASNCLDPVEKEKILDEVKTLRREFTSTPTVLHDGEYIRVKYIRYADDWIIGVNGSKKLAIKLRQECADYFTNVLKLNLNFEKTHIRHAKTEKSRFLGTELKVGNNGDGKIAMYTSKNGIRYKKRVTGWQPIMTAPVGELVRKLADKGFCDHDGNPKSKASWSVLDDIQIIELIGSVWLGLHNYYSFVDNRHALGRIQYILLHSAAKTLAHKHRSSVKKTFKRHGGNNLTVTVKNKDSKVVRKIAFPYKPSLTRQQFEFMTHSETVNDGGKLQTFIKLRTRSKLFSPCCICGETENIEMHHVKHVRKIGEKVKGFTAIMAKINRKQVPVCHACHVKIHNGKYDGLKLSEFALPKLAKA